ncbi:MAG: hypothetical protein KDA41_17630, partial [Planctomycetales bacterium]|nr:hypothetical protein [Planctomycetales bacterium]
MSRMIFRNLAALGIVVAAASPLYADPFAFTWSGVVDASSVQPVGIAINDPFTITVIMDNGGASSASQSWTSADWVSTSINVNSGAYTGSLTDTGGGPFQFTGSFQTGAGSTVTAVPSAIWNSTSFDAIGSDSLGSTNLDGFVNGTNGVWYFDAFQIDAS